MQQWMGKKVTHVVIWRGKESGSYHGHKAICEKTIKWLITEGEKEIKFFLILNIF